MSTVALRRAALRGGVCASLGLVVLGCGREREPWDTPVPAPRLVRVAPRPSVAREYVLSPNSRVELQLGLRQRTMAGHLPVSAGHVWLDAHDLSATRATLTFDLAGIALSPAPAAPASRPLTDQSLNWLELGGARDGSEHRQARFTLRAVGSASSNDAIDAQPVPASQPGAVARRVRLRASGELELHGHRLPQTVSLVLTFEWAHAAEPAGPPSRLEVVTAEPFGVDLLGHAIVPRDARGEVLADGLAELRKVSAHPVHVRAHWVAELAPNGDPR